MTDIEITRLCAEAMGCTDTMETVWDSSTRIPQPHTLYRFNGQWINFDPLHDDAQAMALVKKFYLTVGPVITTIDPKECWVAHAVTDFGANADTLNRAVCLCVAKMQKARASL